MIETTGTNDPKHLVDNDTHAAVQMGLSKDRLPPYRLWLISHIRDHTLIIIFSWFKKKKHIANVFL